MNYGGKEKKIDYFLYLGPKKSTLVKIGLNLSDLAALRLVMLTQENCDAVPSVPSLKEPNGKEITGMHEPK